MSLASSIANLACMTSTGARYFATTRDVWADTRSAWRYFWAAHRPNADQAEIFTASFGTMRLIVRPSDWCAVNEVFVQDEYGIVDYVLAGKRGMRVLDLGANIGLFAARVFYRDPTAQIWSIEPSPSTFALLEANCRQNASYDWSAMRYAVWHTDGNVDFEETRYSTASHVSDLGQTRVPAIRLRRLMEQCSGSPIDVIKMDIEGAEEAVLCEAEDALDSIECLIVEVHPKRSDLQAVCGVLRRVFPYGYVLPHRHSTKPVFVATKTALTACPLLPSWTS